MTAKTIERILPPARPHMVGDGFKVHNFFPMGHPLGRDRMSPFFLLDYGPKTDIPPSPVPRGVGAHPHRGFETVTIAYHGRVAHHDSAGNSGVIGEGDVQWMTAGAGVLHKEYHEKEFSRKGGPMQMAQLWVNLPARHKLAKPKYQALTRAGMGRVELPGGAGEAEIIAGEFMGVKGPASTFTPMHLFNLRLKAGGTAAFRLPEGFNTGMLVVQGGIEVNGDREAPRGQEAPADHFVLFENAGEEISVRALMDSVVLVLSGEPIDEPIAAHGPFVMNTQREIMQAVEDFNAGKFGRLE